MTVGTNSSTWNLESMVTALLTTMAPHGCWTSMAQHDILDPKDYWTLIAPHGCWSQGLYMIVGTNDFKWLLGKNGLIGLMTSTAPCDYWNQCCQNTVGHQLPQITLGTNDLTWLLKTNGFSWLSAGRKWPHIAFFEKPITLYDSLFYTNDPHNCACKWLFAFWIFWLV